MDDDDDEPQVRKRRYKPKKADDEDDAPSGGRGRFAEDDDDDEDDISTGNVYLDIALDFRDDCIDWAKAHVLYAIIICVLAFLLFSALSFYVVYSCVRYINRPSLEKVIRTYDLGLFPETKLLADYALSYISATNRPEVRAPFQFLQGAAICALAERVPPADQRDYYLMAANFLKQSALYNFLPSRAPEGWFLLGKSLFHLGELEQCRIPLHAALADGYPYTKDIHWLLANAYFLGASPDMERARHHLHQFQTEPTLLEEELAESRLLETIITLHMDGIEEAEAVLRQVPRFRQFALKRNFVDGQIELFKAREQVQIAFALEHDPNPNLLRPPLIRAPITASEEIAPEEIPPEPTVPEPIILAPEDIPIALAPVSPIDESALQEFMLSRGPPAAVVGIFDESSEVQQRIAAIRSRYAQNAADDGIIILPREDAQTAPMPPEDPDFDFYQDDPILQRVQRHRDAAHDHYERAIELFTEVVHHADVHNPWGRFSRLLIGVCHLETSNFPEASEHFRRLFATFPDSSEAVAANFLLGEHNRMLGNHDVGFRAIAQAFHTVRQNPNYASLWLPMETMIERSIEMIRRDVENHDYAYAIRLLNMLAGVKPVADRARMTGEVHENWAEFLQSQADVTFGEEGEQLAREAAMQWRHAGAAFAALAEIISDTLEFSDLLWRAAENYRVGKDYRRAIAAYRNYVRVNLVARRPEVYFRMGEMFLHLDGLNEVVFTLEEALRAYPTHNLVPQMRLILSYAYRELQEWDKAKALLRLNLIGDAAPTSTPYRDSMYLLGEICFDQGNFEQAIPYYEDAIRVHPDAPQAADANYHLALAYFRISDDILAELSYMTPDAVRRSVEATAAINRRRALAYFEQAEFMLLERQQTMGLTEAERMMLINTHFMTCRILLSMGQYEQAIPKLNTAATMFQDRAEALHALIQMAHAMRMIGQDEESQTTLRRAEVILNYLEQIGTIEDGEMWRNKIRRQAP